MNALEPTLYIASFSIVSSILSAQEISDRLQLTPSSSCEKGSPVSSRKPEGPFRQESEWSLDRSSSDNEKSEVAINQDKGLEPYVEELVMVIESRLNELQSIASDCEMEFYCSCFASNEDPHQSFAVTLSPSILQRIASLPCSFTMVVYPPDNE